jgi:O-acetylserine/cysteine efflux transporter
MRRGSAVSMFRGMAVVAIPHRLVGAALVAAAALWGAAASGTKYALGGFAPLTLLAIELVAATAALWVALAVRRRWSRPDWRLAAALGLLEPALAYVGDTVGLARTTAANAVVINGLECMFVVLLAAALQRRRIAPRLGLAVLLGLLGLAVLEQVPDASGPHIGDLYVLVGTLSAAAYTLVAGGIADDVDCLSLTAAQFTIATALVVPVAMAAWSTGAETVPTHVAPRYWLAAALVGISGFALSFLLYNHAVSRVDPRAASVVLNLIAPFGLVTAVVWLGERLTIERAAGALLIGLSVALFTRFERPDAGGPAPHQSGAAHVDPATPLEQIPLRG